MYLEISNYFFFIIIISFLFLLLNLNNIKKYIKLINNIIFIFITIIFFFFLISFFITDFSCLHIALHSNITNFIYYKLFALWGSSEGSLILFNYILLIYSYIYIFKEKKEKESIIILLFLLNLLFLIINLNTNIFFKTYFFILKGESFNPLLQDAIFIIHPPFLYLGYIGYIIPFTILIIYLIENYKLKNILNPLKLFSYISWIFLTLGLSLGAWWAYHELGWGGWWYWDPVENIGLIPWILTIGLIHTFKVLEKKIYSKFKFWLIFFSILIFIFNIFGTYLVRSGYLTSVHSFVQEKILSNHLLFILLIIIVIFTILSFNSKLQHYKFTFPLETRIFNFHILNVFLLIIFIIIFIGSFVPSFINQLVNKNITELGPTYYYHILIPFTIPFLLLMCISPFLNWKTSIKKSYLLKKLELILISTLISYIFFFQYLTTIFNHILIFLSFFLLYSLLFFLFHSSISSMIFSHFGFYLLIVGSCISYFLKSSFNIYLWPGDLLQLTPFMNIFILLKDIQFIHSSSIDYLYLNLYFYNEFTEFSMFPEKRFFIDNNLIITKTTIFSNFFHDIYTLFGDLNDIHGIFLRVSIYPLISLIWLSTFFFVLGIFYKKKIKNKLIWY